MHRVTVSVLDAPSGRDGCWLLFPRPLEAGLQRMRGMRLAGFSELREIVAVNSVQRAFVGRVESRRPEMSFELDFHAGTPAECVYRHGDNRYTRASTALVDETVRLVAGAADEASQVDCLVAHTAAQFAYDHPDRRFNDGMDAIPTLCGTTRGSCVDMHGYLLASARSLGLHVQYLAGYWFGPGRDETLDFHCWLVFELDGRTVFWDLAHHLKWGISPLAPGLNPAGGRRVLMSYGRGQRFDTPVGQVELSHFSEPVWLLPDGTIGRPELAIRIGGLPSPNA
jgi:hypothetical protein